MPPIHDDGASPRPEPRVLQQRLESLRQSMGACRLGLARRLAPLSRSTANEGPGPFEVLAVAGESGELDPARALPLEAFHEMLVHGRPLDLTADGVDPVWKKRLSRWEARRILGWPLPSDRLPSVLFVALYSRAGRDPGAVRMEVARGGMEALARALAPPSWLPLAPSPSVPAGDGARNPFELDGQDRHLRRLRHELSRLVVSELPVLVEAEPGCGARFLVRKLGSRPGTASTDPVEFDASRATELLEQLASGRPQVTVLLHAPAELAVGQQLELEALLRRRENPKRGPRLISLHRGPLWPEVLRGALRQDLYWMLAALRVHLPPLRDRPDDVISLFRRAWSEARLERGLRPRELQISAPAAAILKRADWPGNLEQLRREARRVVELHAEERRLLAQHLSDELDPTRPHDETGLEGLLPLSEAVAAVEELMIRRALRVAEGNKADAARRLQLSRQGLYRKLRRYGMLSAGDATSPAGRRALDSAEDSA